MSWSVSAMGKGVAVGRELHTQFERLQGMLEPEQSIKERVSEIVGLATRSAPETGFLVRAEGTQYTMVDKVPQVQHMHLKVEIDIVAFVE